MKILNYLLKNVMLINILFLSGAITLAVCLIGLYSSKVMIPAIILPKLTAAQEESAAVDTRGTLTSRTPSLSDFMTVAENNLFHPERRVPPDKKEETAPKPELILFGTLIDGKEDLAFIEDKRSPKTTPGRGKRQVTVKKGDVLNGFAVTAIETDRIRLVRGEEMLVFHLMDTEKRKGEASSAPDSYTSGSAPNTRSNPSPSGPRTRPKQLPPAP
jgi:hypothetical protein